VGPTSELVKSHVLFHLAYRLQSAATTPGRAWLCRVIIEMPEKVRGFHDVYRRIVGGMPVDLVAERAYVSSGRRGQRHEAGWPGPNARERG